MAYCRLDEFKSYVRNDNWTCVNTRRAFKTKDKLGWDDANVAEMLLGLTRKDFQKSVPNCDVKDFPGHDRIDADQYEIDWDENEKVRKDPGQGTVVLSLKIAIAEDVNGPFACLVTFHLSGSP